MSEFPVLANGYLKKTDELCCIFGAFIIICINKDVLKLENNLKNSCYVLPLNSKCSEHKINGKKISDKGRRLCQLHIKNNLFSLLSLLLKRIGLNYVLFVIPCHV